MSRIKIQNKTAREVAAKLLDIGAIKLNHQKPFTWSSGWKSPIYCDNRLALSYPPIRSFIKKALAMAIRENFPQAECIAGVATAGIPQGTLVAEELGLPFVYVRPKPKEHGMGNLIEGKIELDQKVVLVEDLISTGGSSLKAALAMREAGFDVIGMVAIFTYGFDQSEKSFEDEKVSLICLSDFNHLLQEALDRKYLDENQLVYVKSWRLDPANWK
ncbi:MAG: orotate phosphoribosyltransferase [Cytophagales bacterium]|jgi:orotate phosphoribosyltransferase|nr:orotate phosphoribosyltransferase [Cytophagales bacterium]MCA6386748.1 orotate phosphoribosyltransferase [Cytophagales bacterium]MCA6391615.1 orotate phosphoribosyltransferase [Cytophagales bacterium]MCA6396778.1 orotate phosphoribosyltransferase [Cytophagales bacterium]MCA6399222.1 orotate phosphoribosyltransferase [Cytophagales bacterium]